MGKIVERSKITYSTYQDHSLSERFIFRRNDQKKKDHNTNSKKLLILEMFGTSMKTEYCLSKQPYTIPAIKNTIVTLHFQRKK